MEIDASVAVVQEMGRRVGMPTPMIDTVPALTKLRAEMAALEATAAAA